mgnify:FL=1
MNKTNDNKRKNNLTAIKLVAAVIILALIFGCVLWLKQIHKPESSTSSSSNNQTSSTAEPTQADKEYCFDYEKMCLDYPENWTVKSFSKDASSAEYPGHRQEVAVFSSPNKSINLNIHTGAFGDAGLCDMLDTTIRFIDKNAISLDKIKANQTNRPEYTQLHAVSLVTNLPGQNEITANVTFYRSNWLDQAPLPAEKPYCEALSHGSEIMINTKAGVATANLATAAINSFEDSAQPFTFDNIAAAETFLQKDDVKAAQRILASVHY